MNSRRLPESLEGTRRAASGAEQEMGWAKPGPQAALSFPTPTPNVPPVPPPCMGCSRVGCFLGGWGGAWLGVLAVTGSQALQDALSKVRGRDEDRTF